ncbi:MAG: FecR domain-containing protein [Rhodothermales bacterium]
MRDAYEAILHYDELTPEERGALRDELETHPELRTLLTRWQMLGAHVRERLNHDVPDRSLLVLYALEAEGVALSDEESARLHAGMPALRAALEAHPGLEDVTNQIREASRDFSQLWEEVPAAPARRDRAPSRRRGVRALWSNRLAGALVILAVVGSLSVYAWRSEHLVVVRTDPGQSEDIVFADGSTIRLHGKSRLSYRRRDDAPAYTRTVSLRGQAFFHIIPGNEAFVVETPAALTRAIGTSFSVEASLAETRVILANGQVSVTSRRWNHPPVTLAPGEMSRIQVLRAPTPPVAVQDMTRTLSWSGYLVFHDTPLRDVASHLSRTYGAEVTVAPSLEEERFTATLSPDSLSIDQTMNLLATAFNGHVDRNGAAFHLATGAP